MLTYITTYCDNPELLEQALDTMQQCPDERLKMIVVDDCSDESPADLIAARGDSRISLYRITENLGFNSHGARNLAMQETTTEWNLLVDIDFRVIGIQSTLDQVADGELETNIPHFFSVTYGYQGDQPVIPTRASINDYLVTKTAFWKAKGYDPEYFGWHHGDRTLLHRLVGGERKHNSLMFGTRLDALRSPFADTKIDPDLKLNEERYSDNRAILYVSPESQKMLMQLEAQRIARHAANQDIDLTPFTWEKVI